MNRRDMLAALAAGTAALAGCTQGTDGGDDTPSSTPGETPTDPEKTVAVTLGEPRVVPYLVSLDSPDSIGVYGDRTTQHLLVEMSTDEKIGKDSFQLVAGEAKYEPIGEVSARGFRAWGYGRSYFDVDETQGWAIFDLPKPLSVADDAALRLSWPGGSQPLRDEVRTQLGRPPASFSVSVSATETASRDSPAELALTVENTGETDGRFVGALNRSGPRIAYTPVTAVELDVAAGETETWTHTYELDLEAAEEGQGEFRFHVNWPEDSASRTVQVLDDAA